MDDYRKQSKIDKLNQAFPGMNCGNPHCEELCAEVYDAAKAMRLDPIEAIRKTVERELHCRQADRMAKAVCRFGFEVRMDSLILTGEKNRKDNIIHIFRTGVDECKKCQDLDGTRISPEIWADESKMKEKGFWKQKNGEYLPHPHCRCHWEEEIGTSEKSSLNDFLPNKSEKKTESQKKEVKILNQLNSVKKEEKKRTEQTCNRGENTKKKAGSLTFYVAGEDYGNIPIFGTPFLGLDDLVTQIEDGNYVPHSLFQLNIINHSGTDNAFPLGTDKNGRDWTLHDLNDPYVKRLRYYLNPDSIVDIRMCKTISHEKGQKTAQRLADLLGCQVRAYGGYVSPLGTRPGLITKRVDPDLKWHQRIFPDTKVKKFLPRNLDKIKK